MTTAIETTDLRKSFRGVDALKGLNLSVPEGSIYTLVGPNGAGKTTAIKIFMNILGPSNGTANVLGLDSRKVKGKALCNIGYVSENQKLPLWMRVRDFLAYHRPFYPTWDKELERQLIIQFDLPANRKLKHLSRGMRMKAALASALAFRPKLVVMDEPFSGLDPLVRDQLCQAIVQRPEGSTVFLSSHDLAEIESFGTHLGFLDGGVLRLSEEITSLSTRFQEVDIYFEDQPPSVSNLPTTWIQISAFPSGLRFIDSDFSEERTRRKIADRFLNIKETNFRAMSLREIFVALARTSSNRRSPDLQ